VTNSPGLTKSEAEIAQLDITAMVRDGLADPGGAAHRALFGAGAVGAAIVLDRLQVIPRSLTYLAEVVRAGGTRYGAELPEPLPEPAQTEAIRPWLTQAAKVATTVDDDEDVAQWLAAVAAIIAVRVVNRGEQLPP
jgi:hypothetical protein